MEFFTDKTEVFFSCFEKAINVSSVLCEIQLPFMSSPLVIRCYGAIITFGLILAVLFGGRRAYVWKIDVNKMFDVLLVGLVLGVIGARAYYVLSEWDKYAANPAEIFTIWHGGLAIYGGLIGGLIGALIVCIAEKINILNLLDLCGMSFLIGQGIGRWGNFCNQEAFGTNTTLPWGMYSVKTQAYLTALVNSGSSLKVDPTQPVHPTFLYESLWCLIGFAFLYWYCQKKRKFSGQIFLLYGMIYGAERTVVEGLRTDSLYLPGTNIRTSQLVSLILFGVCLVLYLIFTIKYTRNPKPIEGVDYFKEIPVYNKKKAALDAKKNYEKAVERLTKLQESGKTGSLDGLMIKGLTKKTERLKADYDKKQKASDEADAKKAAKLAAKEQKKLQKKGLVTSAKENTPAEEE